VQLLSLLLAIAIAVVIYNCFVLDDVVVVVDIDNAVVVVVVVTFSGEK